MISITSREFNHDTAGAKKAARKGPVFITDRGKPAHVLLSIEEYRKLTGGRRSVLASLAQTGPEGDFDVEFPRSKELFKPIDLD